MTLKYTVAIIGCGSIGAMKADKYDRLGGDNILTHAHAFHDNTETDLVALVDTNPNQARQAAAKWNAEPFFSVDDLIRVKQHIDIVVVAVLHGIDYHVLGAVRELSPLLVIAEKPFCSNSLQARTIASAYNAAAIPVMINYTRRYDATTMRVLTELREGEYGKIHHIIGMYGRGLKRDGCHAIDLLNYVGGELRHLQFVPGPVDNLPNDPSDSLFMKYEQCDDVQLLGMDSRKYKIFEFQFVTDKGIFHFMNYGQKIMFYRPAVEKTWGSFHTMNRDTPIVQRVDLTTTLKNVAQSAVDYLDTREPILCTMTDAIKVHEVIEMTGGVR